VRAGYETPFRLGGGRVDWHDGDQIDLLRDEVLDLRGLRGEVPVWVPEIEDDLVACGFLHALLDILVKLEAAAVSGGADLVRVRRGGEGSRADNSKRTQSDRGGEPQR
jgi:hypothetical protein